MRASLWPGLIQALQHNLARQQSRVRLFESGLTFIRDDAGIEQHPKLAGLAYGEIVPEQWSASARKVDFFDIKADVELVLQQVADASGFRFEAAEHPALHPGQAARISRVGRPLGWIGLLHPQVQKALDLPGGVFVFEVDLVALRDGRIPAFEPLSKYPSIRRDFALLVSRGVTYQAVRDVVEASAPPIVKDIKLFDVYTGENIDSGLKSLALSLILQESSHTLTDIEVEQASGIVLAALADKLDARLRD
jgi:phenylalanyl-tRNA synthetase beta chain